MANPRTVFLLSKYSILVVNFLFIVLGFFIISLAVEMLRNYNEFETFLETRHFQPAVLLLFTGCTMISYSSLGAVGVIKRNAMFVNISGFVLLTLIVVENVFVFYTYTRRWEIQDDIKVKMNQVLNKYNEEDYAKMSWDALQEDLHCCGVTYPSEWAPMNVKGCSIMEKGLAFTVPYSCSKDMYCKNIYQRGCLKTLERIFLDYFDIITMGFFTLMITQLLKLWMLFGHVKQIQEYVTIMELRNEPERSALLGQGRDRSLIIRASTLPNLRPGTTRAFQQL